MERTLRHLRRIVVPDTSQPPPSAPNISLINCLLGVQQPTWTDEVPAKIPKPEVGGSGGEAGAVNNEIEWYGTALNDSQKEAIRFCLTADNVACIHGPPGVSPSPLLMPNRCEHYWAELTNNRRERRIPSSNSSSSSFLAQYPIETPARLGS